MVIYIFSPHCLIEESWNIVVWHLDIKWDAQTWWLAVELCRGCPSTSCSCTYMASVPCVVSQVFSAWWWPGTRVDQEAASFWAGCMASNSTAVISELSVWCASLLFPSGLEQLNSSLFDVIRMCALCGGENKLQGLTVLLFLPLAPPMCGYVSILLCGQMRLRQSVSSCCVGINGPLSEPTISVQICLMHLGVG